MAFTVTARHNAASPTTAATSRATDSVTPTADSLLLCVAGAEHDGVATAAELTLSGGSLTWTDIAEIDGEASPNWTDTNAFRTDAGLYRATVGASPSAFAITLTTTVSSYIPIAACDITGHDTTTPIVQQASNSAAVNPQSSAASSTVTLSSAPTSGNLIVVGLVSGADSGGGFASPTAGVGKTFSTARNQTGGYTQAGLFYRVADGTESTTITCSDVGDDVGNWLMFAVEIAAEAGSSSFTGTAAAALPAAQASASGTVTAPSETGTAAVTLPLPAAAASGTHTVPAVAGAAAITLPTPTAYGTSGRFPVSVSGRNLLDATGTAWFGVGDAPWALIGQLSTSDITTYLEDRADKGYRLVMFSAPEWWFADNAPNNYYNDAAFTGTAFQSPLNDDYWQVVDHALNECVRLGLTALVCPAYWGNGDGVAAALTAASNAQAEDYGEALGARYKDYPNIMWLAGHDLVPTATMKDRYEAIQTGMATAGDSHLWVPGGWHDNSTYSQGITDWGTTSMSFDMETNYDYSYQPVESTKAAWDNGTLPVLYIEGRYENENSSTPLQLRYQGWGALVAGAFAHIYGNNPIWHFNSDGGTAWTGWLDDTAAVDLTYMADMLAAHDWSGTVPDTTDTFLTVGESSGTTQAGARFGGTLALVYMPTARSVTLDLTELTGTSFTITRIDPASGAKSVLTASASGSHVVASQGTNSGGDTDWVLLIESNGTDATGTAAATLLAVTASGSGTVTPPAFTGTAAVDLPTVTAAASGTYTPPPITGTAAPTLPAATVSAAGTVENPPGNAGSAAVTLPAVTADASGTVTVPPITGTSALTLPTVTAAASGTIDNPGFDGTASVTLPTPTVAATGTFVPAGVTGTAAVQIPSPTVAAAGTRTIPPITGTAAVTLPALTASGYSEFPAAPASRTLTIPAESRTVVVT